MNSNLLITGEAMNSALLITGRISRATLDRILYGGWSIVLWNEGPHGVVALVDAAPDYAAGGFGSIPQADRLRSLGTVGVVIDPSHADVGAAIERFLPLEHLCWVDDSTCVECGLVSA